MLNRPDSRTAEGDERSGECAAIGNNVSPKSLQASRAAAAACYCCLRVCGRAFLWRAGGLGGD